MPLVKWEPFNIFDEMDRAMSEFPSSHVRGFSPAMDVYQTKDAIMVETPLAGVDPNDVDISIENDVLTIKGEARKESEVDEKDYYRKEIRTGGFFRSVALPAHVSSDKARASSKDGMLKIEIPKAPEAKPKTIKVSVKK